MTQPIPSIGRIVHYKLGRSDVEQINRVRENALEHLEQHREDATGLKIHCGNEVNEGEVYPMIITRVWSAEEPKPNSLVNGQVFLDGNDQFWATSVGVGDTQYSFSWPVIKK